MNEEYYIDMEHKTEFSAVVEFNDGSNETVDFSLDKKDTSLTYDEVVDAIYDIVDKKHKLGVYSYDYDPDCEYDDDCFDPQYKIVSIVVIDGGEAYPVLHEDEDTSSVESSREFTKYLVLPWARYSLTPEAKLWMELIDNGIIDKDAPFDFDKYHKILTKKD